MTRDEFLAENTRLRHALQTGILWEQQYDEHAAFYQNNPTLANIVKHLRTGLDCAMVEQAAIIHLLIDKGLITEAEYFEKSLEFFRREIKNCEARLSAQMGRTIHLG